MNSSTTKVIIFFLSSFLFMLSCSDDAPIPRPKGYFRINFPAQTYQIYKGIEPIKFEYPSYAKVIQKKSPKNETWFNIEYPQFHAALHITYIDLNHAQLKKCLQDAHDLAFKHAVMASAIDESSIQDSVNDVYGLVYSIKGNAASNYQFYLTDSTDNFLRASLYFHRIPNADSLKPVVNFIIEGADHFIKTMRWEKSDAK